MAAKVFECEICNEDYDATDRKPTGLPCGHTFCYLCLVRIEESDNTCPQCREFIEQPLDKLPVVFALLPPSQKPEQETDHVHSEVPQCSKHDCDLDHFCADCGVIVCRKCVRQSHQHHWVEFTHDILCRDPVAANFAKELKRRIEAKMNKITNTVSVSSKIFQSLNQMKACEDELQQHVDVLVGVKASATEDLNLWTSRRSRPKKEEQELLERLCTAWKEHDSLFLDKKMSADFGKKMDEMIATARQVQELAEKMKISAQPHLPSPDAGWNSGPVLGSLRVAIRRLLLGVVFCFVVLLCGSFLNHQLGYSSRSHHRSGW